VTRILMTAAALLCVGLTGCATRPPAPAEGGVEAADLGAWSLTGKLAVRHPEERVALSIRWRQRDERYRIDLSGPLGAGGASIEGDPRSVAITTAEGTRRARSPEALLAKTLGWSLPVSAVRWWVLGVPAPGSRQVLARDEAGRLAQLRQRGWRIEYERWTEEAGYALPTVIRMRRNELRVRLVVARWEPGERRDVAVAVI